mmetsp:Transcript_10547/g.31818  ORF Transcript_10547/g.31818 Transcript_10547/m.31818 type:complete len:95 (+) Transcript_10547:78-362(+)
MPPVRAEYADPNATPNENFVDYVDAALRAVAQSLLESPAAAEAGLVQGGEPAAAAEALAYLRDRVGVPRDMPHRSAQLLRAHLNHIIDALEKQA